MGENKEEIYINESRLNDLNRFFIGMTLICFMMTVFLIFTRNIINTEEYQTGNILGGMLYSRFIEYGMRVITTIPIFVLVHHFKKKSFFSKYILTRTILSVITFFYIAGGLIMPFVETTISTSYEMSDMIMLFLGAFVMFYIGVIGNNKMLMRLSYVFVVTPWIVTGTYFALDMYYQYIGVVAFPSQVASIIIGLKTLCYKICPLLCYLIISLQIKKCSF